MKKIIAWTAGILLFAFVALLAITYSWTYTPVGRLEYQPAILAKLSYWNHAPLAFDPESIRIGNAISVKLIGVEKPARGLAISDIAIDTDSGKIPVRIYRPEGTGPFPTLVNYHGGGFFAGEGFAFDAVAMQLAVKAKVVVFSVDYRLAPAHPFPAAVDDSYRALQWVAEHAAEYGGDPSRLGVMGQSAGGNLAAVMALKARDEGGPKLAFQYLEVPAVDATGSREWRSMKEAGENYFLKVSLMGTIQSIYVPRPEDRRNPYVSPLLAANHRDLPPALIVVAQFDPLRDQGIAYAEALKKDGVPVQLEVAPGVLHGFLGSPQRALKNLETVQQALARVFPRPAG